MRWLVILASLALAPLGWAGCVGGCPGQHAPAVETAWSGDAPVHFGGPVQTSRGFVLHSDDYSLDESTLSVTPGVSLTATMEVLKALGEEAGPEKALFALGYAGWGAGQLEAELQQNAWLIGEVEEDFIFDPDLGGKWLAALAMIGVDPAMMSDEMGRA